MSAPSLDSLLDLLTSGDEAAAAQVFRIYEPTMRMVVRRQLAPHLRSKFDSLDVVQSVWVHLLKGFREAGWRFADTAHLQAFLLQLTRHRFIDRLRRLRRPLQHEQPLWDDAPMVGAVQPQEVLQAAELWEQLWELCPPAHRDILLLKRDGAPTAEVARQTGLHEGSVRRILQELWQRLARRQGRSAS